jgi:AraC-like DNA-binding protein
MKPLLKIIETQQNNVFHILNVHEPYFFPAWHFHPECEIMLVLEGTGMRFVGDSMERFEQGDLVFYGPNIPHFYRSDEAYYKERSTLLSRAIVIYFKEDFLGESFWDLADIQPVRKLFAQARRGIKFPKIINETLSRLITDLREDRPGVSKVIGLLTILQTMADSRDMKRLSSIAYSEKIDENDCERINKVYQFIMDNYARNPSLEEISQVACMTSTAFCRYFKSHTHKTYTQFLNEVKVGSACKLLIDNKFSISQICFEVGFNNFPHFNDQFKKIMGITPRQYQFKHLHQES